MAENIEKSRQHCAVRPAFKAESPGLSPAICTQGPQNARKNPCRHIVHPDPNQDCHSCGPLSFNVQLSLPPIEYRISGGLSTLKSAFPANLARIALLLSPQGNLHMSVSGCSCIVKENLPPQGKAFGERWGHGGRKSLFGFEKGFLPPYAELLQDCGCMARNVKHGPGKDHLIGEICMKNALPAAVGREGAGFEAQRCTRPVPEPFIRLSTSAAVMRL